MLEIQIIGLKVLNMLNRANFEEMMGGNANRRRLRNGGVPKGFHRMPDGTIMKNSDMKKKSKKQLRRP